MENERSMNGKLGFIVNPIAGMGGRVGLKGTDGPGTVERARALGAEPRSPERARLALSIVREKAGDRVEIVTGPGELGESVARAAGFAPTVVGELGSGQTTAADTERIARALVDAGVDLIMFAGGDGTARNIRDAIGEALPVIGIPTGVKIHSAVYATHPRTAGELAANVLLRGAIKTRAAEVMDIDETAFRAGRVSATLYGYLLVPNERTLLQGLKAGSGGGEQAELGGIGAEVAKRMGDGALWILGPGTTTRAVAEQLGIEKTLLGVDLVSRGEVIARDLTESALLAYLDGVPARLVVTPIGGQGFLFGRGNQQLSAEVIRRIGRENIHIVATSAKLAALRGAPFLVDTGDPAIDAQLAGYTRVITGLGKETVYKIA
jgi:predicted polyphosphate/ATP-dependent NAD kinase